MSALESEDVTVELPREDTVPRCQECLHEVLQAGPIPPTSAEGAQHASPDSCLRGDAWGWCATRGRLSLWAPRESAA